MKTLKYTFLTLFVSMLMFSCSKKQDLISETDLLTLTETSAVIKIVTNGLKSHIKSDGNFNNPTDPESSTRFDFGFIFKYPTTLSYNNKKNVTVNNIFELATILASTTSTNFISGISFPFKVLIKDTEQTINNEQAFSNLVQNYDTDKDGNPNYLDIDDDNDGVTDIKEDLNKDGDATNDDADNDGLANYQDTDSDNDGQIDSDEDNDGDGDFTNNDSDKDGKLDYVDSDSDNDGIKDGNDNDDDNDGTNDVDEDHNGTNHEGDDEDDHDENNNSNGG